MFLAVLDYLLGNLVGLPVHTHTSVSCTRRCRPEQKRHWKCCCRYFSGKHI